MLPVSFSPYEQLRINLGENRFSRNIGDLPFTPNSITLTRHLRSLLNQARECLRNGPNEDFSSPKQAMRYLERVADRHAGLSSEGHRQGLILRSEASVAVKQGKLPVADAMLYSPFFRADSTESYLSPAVNISNVARVASPLLREWDVDQKALTVEMLEAQDSRFESEENLDLRIFCFFSQLTANPKFDGKDIFIVSHGHYILRLLKLCTTEADQVALPNSMPNGAMLQLKGGCGETFMDTIKIRHNLVSPKHGGAFWNRRQAD